MATGLAAAAWSQPLQFEVLHKRALRDRPGLLTFHEDRVEYHQTLTPKQQAKIAKGKKAPKLESARWDYTDIQQLWLSPEKAVVLTYEDRRLLLGADRQFEFQLRGKDQSFAAAYDLLRKKLDQRFVAALADPNVEAEWVMPVKLLGAVRGSEGVLRVGSDRIVYRTGRKEHSRTWRLADIENVSTSGPFQLTLTTYERARLRYGSLRSFHFQLKERLDERRFDRLWRRLNQDKGLEFLTSIQERKP